MKRLLFYSSLLLTLLSLLGCSPQRRITRIVSRHPELILTDTINYSRLVVRPSRSALLNMPDSIFNRLQPGDSIISVSKKGVTIIVRRNPQSTEIGAYVPADTVRADTNLVVSKIKIVPNDRAQIYKLRIIYIGCIILLILVVFLILKRVINGR